MKYTFFADAGHGWLRVKRSEVESLGLTLAISHCSYQRGDWVYLEEDSDLTRFLNAKGITKLASVGIRKWCDDNILERTSERSSIRNYERYTNFLEGSDRT